MSGLKVGKEYKKLEYIGDEDNYDIQWSKPGEVRFRIRYSGFDEGNIMETMEAMETLPVCGRACQLEATRFYNLLKGLPDADRRNSKAPVFVEEESENSINLSSLVSPSHPTVSKIIVIFSSLVNEAESLHSLAVNKYFPALLLYGEMDEDGEDSGTQNVGIFLPTLHAFGLLVSRVYQLLRHFLQQLRAFYGLNAHALPGVDACQMTKVWRCVGDLLALLMQVDEIVSNRPILKRDWNKYIKAVETAEHNPSQFGVSSDSLRQLRTMLCTIDATLMQGNALRNFYEQSLGELDDDKKFSERMKKTIMEMYSFWDKEAAADVHDRRLLTGIVCLTVFQHLHFMNKDTKLVKTVWASHKRVVSFHLVGDIVWIPCVFLLKEIRDLQTVVDKKSVALVLNAKANLFKEQGEGMITEAKSLCHRASVWCAQSVKMLDGERDRDAAECLQISQHILKGCRISDTMSRVLRTALHSQGGEVTLSKQMALNIFDVIAGIKKIADVFAKHWSVIFEACQLATHQWRCHLLGLIDKGRSLCREASEMARYSAFSTAANALMSSCSRSRLQLAAVALDLACYKKVLPNGESIQVDQLISRMETLHQPSALFYRVSSCSFLFWVRPLIQIYFSTMADLKPAITQVKAVMSAVSDAAAYSCMAAHCPPKALLRKFQNEVYSDMQSAFLFTMCADIENDVRVLIHKHLKVREGDGTEQGKLTFYKSLIANPRFQLYDMVIDVKEFVESYIERTFYNLTTVALHDKHTYSKMGGLAGSRLGLCITDGHLPHCSIDQGLDVVLVVKSLNNFVANFNYSLHQQFFIEKDSSSKSLRVLTVKHMSNSLRSHGMGVLHTSINITYQLLRFCKKMALLSQHLAEEHVRAQLGREIRYFEEHREELNRQFPVKRAEMLNKGLSDSRDGDELNFMDRLRILITQIGNALGLVRALTAAATHVSSQMKEYDTADYSLYDTDDVTKIAADSDTVLVRDIVSDLREQTARNRNFINMLIDVFRNGFADNDKFSYFDNFYGIFPSLTMNYVEHMLTCRERLRKRANVGKQMTFTDDGFVMGVSYITTVLDQWQQLSSLNWFSSVLKSCREEKGENSGGTLERGASLRENRITAYQKEIMLLSYTLQSAKVFFCSEFYSH